MKSFFSIFLTVSALISAYGAYNRLTTNNTAILFIDLQTGLFNGVQDIPSTELMQNIEALVDTAVLFNLPVVLTTSFDTGPNGPIIPYITSKFPNQTIIRRPGQINAFDNEDFVTAVNNTGRKNLVMAGIATDVCLAFAALSAVNMGFNTYAVIDASGTWSVVARETAVERLVMNNVNIMSWFAVSSEIQADWRHATGPGYEVLLSDRLPFYGNLVQQYNVTVAEVQQNMTNVNQNVTQNNVNQNVTPNNVNQNVAPTQKNPGPATGPGPAVANSNIPPNTP